MRLGKIARLPHQIRNQVNRRLHDGESAQTLLSWLNPLPEVQSVLKAHFGGNPLTKQNVSQWKHHGYREWLACQDALDFVGHLQDERLMGEPLSVGASADNLALWVALQYAAAAQKLMGGPSGSQARWRRLRQLSADIARLRRGDLSAKRLLLDRDRLQFKHTTPKAVTFAKTAPSQSQS